MLSRVKNNGFNIYLIFILCCFSRFCYEVAELSWWERKMAATLFADPPVATMEEAREHFVAAETLKPDGWIENRQFLAKCNINLQVIKGMLQIPTASFLH